MNWQQLSTESHYQTAVAVENELHSSNYAEAAAEMNQATPVSALTWAEVFADDYQL